MTPRHRLTIIVVGIAISAVLSGCHHPFGNGSSSGPPAEGAAPPSARLETAGRVSPYHPELSTPPGDQVSPRDPAVERAGYPAVEPETELVPAPSVAPDSLQPPPPVMPPAAPTVPTHVELNPPRPEGPLLAALRCLLENRPDEAIERLKQYDRPNQEMMLGLLALAAGLTKGSLDRASPQECSNVLELLRSQEVQFRHRAQLAIDVKVCSYLKIRKFGNYDLLPPGYAFRAGKNGNGGEPVQLYVEVENFASRARGDRYETLLETRVEILDFRGQQVWGMDFPMEEIDQSYTPRRDYFISISFRVPPEVPPGRYTLRVEVKDVTLNPPDEVPPHRVAERSLDFQVTAGGPPR